MVLKTPDEKPHEQIAKDVVTSKRRYFMPAAGVSVEADSAEDAVKELEKLKKKKDTEVGDATE